MSLLRKALEDTLVEIELQKDEEEYVAFDLDGTVAFYDGLVAIDLIGAPIPKTIEMIKAFLAKGVKVKIFTARLATNNKEDYDLITKAIADYTLEHVGQALESTCIKTPKMVRYYDDRARQVIENDGEIVK